MLSFPTQRQLANLSRQIRLTRLTKFGVAPVTCLKQQSHLVKTVKLKSIKNNFGAKMKTNDDMCNIQKTSPEVLFFMKNVLQYNTSS